MGHDKRQKKNLIRRASIFFEPSDQTIAGNADRFTAELEIGNYSISQQSVNVVLGDAKILAYFFWPKIGFIG